MLLVVAVISACGTAAGTCMAFVTREAFNLGDRDNLTLQLVAGAVYVLAALGIGPVLKRLPRLTLLSHRLVLALLLVTWGLAYMLAGVSGVVAYWVGAVGLGVILFASGYCLSFAASGAAWPIIETYIVGGRSGTALRRAIGDFNMTWSAALPIGVFGLGAVVGVFPLWGMFAAGLMVTLCVLPLRLASAQPGRHGETAQLARPIYVPLLSCARALLSMSMLLAFVLYPIAPTLTADLGMSATLGAISLAVLHLFRFLVFMFMRYWEGWHGRWGTLIWGGCLLFAGFAVVLFAPTAWLLLLGLCALGTASGTIYCAALYYGQALGRTEVEAGGKHEALIGSGFVLGPLAGLMPIWIGVGEQWRSSATLISSLLVCLVASYWIVRPIMAWRREQRRGAPAFESPAAPQPNPVKTHGGESPL